MKKVLLFITILLTVIACTISFPSSSSYDREVETGVAVAFTQTALAAAQQSRLPR
jgi:uncharacterized protein YxeA